MKIEKITAKPPVFEAVQQRYDNVKDIKEWIGAESISITSEMSSEDDPILEITYHVRLENASNSYAAKVYDVSVIDEFCENDWIINFGDGHFEVRPFRLFRELYDVKRPVLPSINKAANND